MIYCPAGRGPVDKAYFVGGLILIILLFLVKTASDFMKYETGLEVCPHSGTGRSMTWGEARELAKAGVCGGNGTVTDRRFCNPGTGTWWIDLRTNRTGCRPACVVDVDTGEATINWRCLGLLG